MAALAPPTPAHLRRRSQVLESVHELLSGMQKMGVATASMMEPIINMVAAALPLLVQYVGNVRPVPEGSIPP